MTQTAGGLLCMNLFSISNSSG